MIRVVLGPADELAVDLAGKQFGRGAWLHPRLACVSQAAPRGLARSFKRPITTPARELVLMLRAAAESRATALVAAATRARHVALGSTAVKEALNSGAAEVVVVATDARAAAATPWIEQTVAEGRALAFGTKEVLGAATGRGEVAVLAILESGIAAALAAAIEIAQMPLPAAGRGTSRVTEVG
jgi:predicted RNA-binding protein YlxR (DUF448 family)